MKILIGSHELLKVCPDCQLAAVGLIPIARTFGKDASRADGYRVYCKGCRKRRREHGVAR